MRYLITFSYDGSGFYGYAKQPDKRTIQEEIETALTKINKDIKVSLNSSGRTDAGVHALAQKAHFDMDTKIETNKLQKSINSLLPPDISIDKVEEVDKDFHARFNAHGKEYIYKINTGPYNPIERNYVYQCPYKLDVVAMERALKYLEGTHNYKSFTKADDEKEDYVRTISETEVIRDPRNINQITLSFTGSGFMRYMVRNMVGTLLEIGEGKIKPEDIIQILKSEDRTKAGKTAPAVGLYLKNVFY